MKKLKLFALMLIGSVIMVSGCKKDDDSAGEEAKNTLIGRWEAQLEVYSFPENGRTVTETYTYKAGEEIVEFKSDGTAEFKFGANGSEKVKYSISADSKKLTISSMDGVDSRTQEIITLTSTQAVLSHTEDNETSVMTYKKL